MFYFKYLILVQKGFDTFYQGQMGFRGAKKQWPIQFSKTYLKIPQIFFENYWVFHFFVWGLEFGVSMKPPMGPPSKKNKQKERT